MSTRCDWRITVVYVASAWVFLEGLPLHGMLAEVGVPRDEFKKSAEFDISGRHLLEGNEQRKTPSNL